MRRTAVVVCVACAWSCSNSVNPAPVLSLGASSTMATAPGSVTLVVAAIDNTAVAKVEFFEGATKLSEAMAAPFVHLVTYAASDVGTHTYSARVTDSQGAIATSAEVTVTVVAASGVGGGAATGGGTGTGGGGASTGGGGASAGGGGASSSGGGTSSSGGGTGGADTTAPTVVLTANANTFSTPSPLVLSAVASDDVKVVKVELFDGFSKLAELSEATAGSTWEFTYALTPAFNGTHHYFVRAWDAALNSSESLLATVNVLIRSPSAIDQVVAGSSFTYLVKVDGSVYAAGSQSGVLGGNQYPTFAQPFPGLEVKHLGASANANELLMVRADDSLAGVGSNAYGQLAMPTTTQSVLLPTPASPAVAQVAKVLAGEYLSCFIKLDTTAWCMGYSYLGSGSPGGSAVPLQVRQADGGQVAGVVEINSGYEAQLLLKSDGSVWAWGRGDLGNGAVGDGTTQNRYGVVQVVTLAGTPVTGASHVTTTRGAGFAVIADGGTVMAWGSNQSGMLGDNSTAGQRLTATAVYALTDIVGIAGGESHVLAVDSLGSVWAWGSNVNGQLGVPSVGTSSNKPVQVPGLSGVVKVAAGRMTSFALKANGELWGWGNDEMALGINDAGQSVPTPHLILVP